VFAGPYVIDVRRPAITTDRSHQEGHVAVAAIQPVRLKSPGYSLSAATDAVPFPLSPHRRAPARQVALLLARAAHVNLVTAYLALSPGGMDSVAIIAASSPVDVPFVMALLTLRLIVVMLLGPQLSRIVANKTMAS